MRRQTAAIEHARESGDGGIAALKLPWRRYINLGRDGDIAPAGERSVELMKERAHEAARSASSDPRRSLAVGPPPPPPLSRARRDSVQDADVPHLSHLQACRLNIS